MPHHHRAILINPERCSVEVIDFDGSLEMMHHLIADDCLDSFRLAEHDDSFDYGWVSDDGLLRGEPVHGFKFRNRRDPFAGLCLITGVDKASRINVNAKITAEFLKDHIDWLGLIVPEVLIDPTETGFRTIVTYAKAK